MLKFDLGEIDLIENGKTLTYRKTSAGTGTGITIAFIEGDPDSAMQTTMKGKDFYLGPERFVEFCKYVTDP